MRKEEGNLITLSEKASLWPRNSAGFVVPRTQQAHLYCREFDPRPLNTWAGASTKLLRLQPERKTKRKRPTSGKGEGRLFGTEPELKVNRNNTVRP